MTFEAMHKLMSHDTTGAEEVVALVATANGVCLFIFASGTTGRRVFVTEVNSIVSEEAGNALRCKGSFLMTNSAGDLLRMILDLL